MRELRKISRLDEIARRIVGGVDEAYEVVKDDRHADVPLVHKVETIRLPMRLVTKEEYDDAQRVLTTENPTQYRKSWYQRVVDRFEKQKTDPKPTYEATIHVLRIGDAAVCATQFEVFTDYGVQIKARSRAVQTFLIQLAGEPTYVPTGRAVRPAATVRSCRATESRSRRGRFSSSGSSRSSIPCGPKRTERENRTMWIDNTVGGTISRRQPFCAVGFWPARWPQWPRRRSCPRAPWAWKTTWPPASESRSACWAWAIGAPIPGTR